jgi:hypothetical protein
MAQVVKHLPRKHEALVQTPIIQKSINQPISQSITIQKSVTFLYTKNEHVEKKKSGRIISFTIIFPQKLSKNKPTQGCERLL